MKVLVTGSSGYVGSAVVPTSGGQIVFHGIDRYEGPFTSEVVDICNFSPSSFVAASEEYVVMHLAACRNDFGVVANIYFHDNVTATQQFLSNLSFRPPKRFVHCSSVAALMGSNIPYHENLSCDDAYRATKYLQAELIREWCDRFAVEYVELLPSAIYSQEIRRDTNVGTLQRIAAVVPVLPAIEVKKSTTELGAFTAMLIKAIDGLNPGRYLCIDRPIRTVSQIIRDSSGGDVLLIRTPGLRMLLLGLSYVLLAVGKFLGVDLKLTPSRVKKLFEDTSFSHESGLDRNSFWQGEQ